MKPSIAPVLITFALICFALVQNTQAVSPPPDGGYPGGNTAEGQLALGSLTTGFYNNAVGIYSLLSLTTGSFNTADGAGALLSTTADENTATGVAALNYNRDWRPEHGQWRFALLAAPPATVTRPLVTGPLQRHGRRRQRGCWFRSASFKTRPRFNTASWFLKRFFTTLAGPENTAIGYQALP
jgi:hypothetical protein